MKINLSHTEVRLLAREYIKVIDAKGSRIVCRRGKVWITQNRDTRDVLLEEGEAFTLDRNGVAIVQALAFAEFALDAPSRRQRPAATRSATLTSLAVLGFARRQTAARRPGRLLPGIERSRHITALAVLGFVRRAVPSRNPHETLARI